MMRKRFLSSLVALALCFSILPAGAFAANGTASAAEGQAETGMVQTPTGEWTSGVRAANTCYQNFEKVQLSGADNQKMVQVARAQLGKTGSDLKYSEEWCADFVTDLAHAVGVSSSIVPWSYSGRAYVPFLYQYMVNQCGAKPVSVEDAKPGDIIFFDWSGYGRANSHVALVIWYDKENKKLTYIGGNQTDASPYYNRSVTEVIRDGDNKYIGPILRPQYATTDYSEPPHLVTVTAEAEGSGTVSGGQDYVTGTEATLAAAPGDGQCFVGWYDTKGTLVSKEASYTFEVTGYVTLKAKFVPKVQISVQSSRSGSVTGTGSYGVGTEATLTAVPAEGKSFEGWYDENGKLLSTEIRYTFTVSKDRSLYALFAGDIFCDVKSNDWYLEYAMESAEKELVQGITLVTFGGEYAFTRAMAVTILARMEKPDMTQVPVSSFADVPKDSYFYDAVNWAAANKIVEGRSADCFDPNSSISRQDFLTIVVRYLEWKGYQLNAQELTYTDMDQIAPYAVPMLQKAQELGLVNGYPEGDFRPQGTMLRRDGVKVLVLLNRYLEANPVPDKDEDADADSGTDAGDDSSADSGTDAGDDSSADSGADAGDASGTDTDDDPGSGTNTDSEPSADVPA